MASGRAQGGPSRARDIHAQRGLAPLATSFQTNPSFRGAGLLRALPGPTPAHEVPLEQSFMPISAICRVLHCEVSDQLVVEQVCEWMEIYPE